MVASTTKGLTGLCGNMCIERDLLDPRRTVATYWPEFAANGKEDALVQWMFDHRVGLPDIPEGADPSDWTAMVTGLAAAAPKWRPGTAHAYHSITYGHLVGELIRRVSGRSVGTFLREEVCEPLGIDAWIGFGPELDDRCADLVGSSSQFASLEWRRNEVPAASGYTNGRALARLYGALARGGDLDEVHLLSRATIEAATASSVSGPWFGWTGEMMRAAGVSEDVFQVAFARGFAMNNRFAYMGPNPKAFGGGGSGGSFAFADPDAQIGFGYAQNAHLGQGQGVTTRSGRLVTAVYEAL
jgi:CubicO group peptidase (beta-lactamase class C family)